MGSKRAKMGDNAKEVETSISLKPLERRETSNKDVLLRLRPIVLGLDDYSYERTLNDLQKMADFLEITQISSDAEDIVVELGKIYLEARKLEAPSITTVGGDVDMRCQEAAIEIRNAILHSNLQDIPDGDGMKVYKGLVPDLQNPGGLIKIVLRPEYIRFWDRCYSLAMIGQPVCGVGNPGIGRTTTSLYLLQKIVREHLKPVVYTIRKFEGEDVFYEFTPVVQSDSLVDVTVNVYNIMSAHKKSKIPAMQNPDAIYFVDPGDFQRSCDDTSDLYEAKFIMVASNDSNHWGGNNFTKFRGSVAPTFGYASRRPGILVYGSLWSGRQVLIASRCLPDMRDLGDNEVLRRFRVVGGSLRDIIMFNEKIFTDKLLTALDLDSVTVNQLVDGRYNFTFRPSAPSSMLVGIGPRDDELTRLKITLRSDYVEECLAHKHLKTSWYYVLEEENAGNRGNIFESYIRAKFSRGPVQFSGNEARESVRERPPNGKRNEKNNYKPANMITIGSKRCIVRVPNIIQAVRNDEQKKFMFYSKDEFEPLIDMIYKVDDGYHAIQSTISKKHDCAVGKIQTLKNSLQLQSGEKLTIFYALPSTRYNDFETNPVNPLFQQPDLINVCIYHVGVTGSED